MAKNIVIVGCQWGDEGKGKIVDIITNKAHVVVRFQGGHNAGHTLVVNGKKTILRLIPSGILHNHIKCFIGSGVVLALKSLFSEIQELNASGLNVESRLKICTTCPLILPYHIAIDNAREQYKGTNKIGTTGRGIGPAYEDKVARRAIRVMDLFSIDTISQKIKENLNIYNVQLKHLYQKKEVSLDDVLNEITPYISKIKPMVADIPSELAILNQQNKNILFEGAQGTMLDVDYGTYPFVTSSNCVAGYSSVGAGVSPFCLNYILGIAKAYTTRVGEGPFPTELFDETGKLLAHLGNEFGSVTGRARRCGWFDLVAIKRAIQINGITGICLTKLDVMDKLDTINICIAYEYQGEKLNIAPFGADIISQCKPIFEVLPGWNQNTNGINNFQDLPENAKNYIKYIQQQCKTPIVIISTGADRNETIIIDNTLISV